MAESPYSTDGWRFDVADTMARNNEIQLHHAVWPKIRNAIKETNKDAYILAEDWSDCTEFLNGNEWDATMNYFSSCRPIRQFYGEADFHLAPAMGDAAKLQDDGKRLVLTNHWIFDTTAVSSAPSAV